jgi:hypothetical protein
MKTRIIVVTSGDGTFRLITELGFPIGSRLLTVAPEPGKDYPDLQDTFPTRLEADRAAIRWNTYLLWADKKKSKQKSRISE